ncbi:ubiquitin domain-containing protein UBFD1-like [Strongylocentrotus purpuratus]|uniref:Ubiquitin-like domain-containing protein n=1 Tax=Strongylocentrotus purpuratus TaxID=7668 RepID=A0A7M7NQ11_STRPU|nr:ubiquitin domain-containing protein UBFD1-like [Strongylocentrotus purpuratus]
MSSDNKRESEETPMEQTADDSSSKTSQDTPGGNAETLKCQTSSSESKESGKESGMESGMEATSMEQEAQCESRTENNSSAASTDNRMEEESKDSSAAASSNGSVVGAGGGSTVASGAAASAVDKGEMVELKIMYNKKKYDVRVGVESTVAELKTEIQTTTGVPPAMQKLMFKGLMKDEKTLKELKVTSGSKLMLIGSTAKAVMEVTKPVPAGGIVEKDEKASAAKEPLSKLKMHKKIIDKGKPDDAMIGIKNQHEPLPNVPISGMLNKAGGKVRLTFKLELDQVWIGTKERTEKINMNSIKNVLSEPIEGHEDYHILAIQLGPTEASRYWIYWVPAQYAKGIKDTVLGKWVYF